MLDSGQVPLGSMLFLGRPQTQEMRLTRAGMSPEFQACLQVPWELTRAHETLTLVPGPACPVSGCAPTAGPLFSYAHTCHQTGDGLCSSCSQESTLVPRMLPV